MRIEKTNKITEVISKKPSTSSSSSDKGFADILATKSNSSAGNASFILPVSTIFIPEIVLDEEKKKKRAKALNYGKKLLEELKLIRISLIQGNLNLQELRNLEAEIKSFNDISDLEPELKKVIEEIELRAAVELAKYLSD